ncbi:N-acetylmannosamine-6-phosphate 2-epimerase [Pararhizobium mangrovi]|nr:putative N-acetylmannosamine-6-phosphate 2-epimerase [Pararhizobium mangrovi]
MDPTGIFQRLKGQLIVSVQPVSDGPMDNDVIVVAMARAAVAGGAAGLRIESARRIGLVRRALPGVPLIGIVKRDLSGSPVRITPLPEDVADLIEAGADIVAIDGTDRIRPHAFVDLARIVSDAGRMVMADIASAGEGRASIDAGATIVGSTLSGYIRGPVPVEPDYTLLEELRDEACFLIAEGRYQSPEQCRGALQRGADCVTVGSALTRLEVATHRFSELMRAPSGGTDHG